MSYLTYNLVQLQLEHIEEFRREDIYDDSDNTYLYTHYLIRVRAVFNPKATTRDPANSTAINDTALKSLLLEERQPLVFSVGPDVILESPRTMNDPAGVKPRARAVVDATVGPHPLYCNVKAFHGVHTFIVEYGIETFQVEADLPNLALSHNWSMSHDYDELSLCTRVIRGQCTFQRDVMTNIFGDRGLDQYFPDMFRRRLFHPIPPGMMRTGVHVEAADDGNTLSYEITDEEQVLNFGLNNPVRRLEGKWTGGNDWVNDDNWANPLKARYWREIHVEVWGNRNATRTNLINACLKAISAWGFDANTNACWQYRSNWGCEINKKYAWVHVGVFTGMVNKNFRVPFSIGGGRVGINRDYPENLIGDGGNIVGLIAPTANPPPPGDGLSRGTYLGQLATQVLRTPGSVPAPPAADKVVPQLDFGG